MSELRYVEGDTLDVERIEHYPLRLYLKDHPYPHKGFPTEDFIESAAKAKRFFLQFRIKAADKALLKIEKEEMTDFAQAILTLKGRTAEVLAYILEYDQAYRFRLQDLANETDYLTFKEVFRLFRIWKSRDRNEIKYKRVSQKFTITITLFAFLLLLPHFRREINRILPRLKPDESDIYWMKLKQDYKYGG